MTKIYVSPSCLTYRQYGTIIKAAYSYGWQPTWLWARQIFHADAFVSEEKALKALASIVHADIFLACLPGTTTTCVEIGAAYFMAQSVFLAAKDPVHFTQTGPCDAYLAVLPDIKRICCEAEDIPEKLKQEYYPLVTGP